ncbi:toll/interleukin-1 receptor domain-containing protein [Alkalinema pantanalense CENA528]|uniref:toll/interleukin-1 receptor domain-containing protein n=1 Tax=Alkalinema pantanalense TaxID=1620705 RepID=UPI003D6EA166
MSPSSRYRVKLFIAYSHQDENWKNELTKHLAALERQGIIAPWHDQCISPGEARQEAIDHNLRTAQIILLLISPDFIASDRLWQRELQQAMVQHTAGLARVIPIILRPTLWSDTPFGHLAPLPQNGKPILSWADRDEAFLQVVEGIQHNINRLLLPSNQSSTPKPLPFPPRDVPPKLDPSMRSVWKTSSQIALPCLAIIVLWTIVGWLSQGQDADISGWMPILLLGGTIGGLGSRLLIVWAERQVGRTILWDAVLLRCMIWAIGGLLGWGLLGKLMGYPFFRSGHGVSLGIIVGVSIGIWLILQNGSSSNGRNAYRHHLPNSTNNATKINRR